MLEPLSTIAVILFGIIYSGMIDVAKPKNKCVKNMAVVANNGFTPLVLMKCYNNFIFDGIRDVIIIGSAVERIRIAELASKNAALLTMVNRQKHL